MITASHVDSTSPPFDLEGLMQRCLGNAAFVERVLGKFQQRGDEDLAELERALAAEDAERVTRLAHRLKGAAANASAPCVHARAAEIEHIATQRYLTAIPERLELLKGEWLRFTDAVAQLSWSRDPAA